MNKLTAFLITVCALLSGCSSPSPYLSFGGANFRTTEAFSTSIYTVGIIDHEGKNKFDSLSSLKVSDLPVEAVTTLYADDTRSAALEAKVEAGKKSPLGTVDVGIDGALKSITANKGKYVIFRTTDVFLLIDEMNEPVNQSALLKLKSRKGPSAIITGVAIVYDNSMAADYSKDFGVTVSAEPSVTPATASAGVQVKTSEKLIRSFSDGTVFAYEYSIIEWDEESRTAKVKNIKLERPNKFVVWWFSM